MMLTLGSLFGGIGAFELAATRAGLDVRWSCEIDAACRSVLARHYPDVRLYDDVRELNFKAVPTVWRNEASRPVPSAQDKPDGSSLVVQGLCEPVRPRDAEPSIYPSAASAMVIDDALSPNRDSLREDDGRAERDVRDLPAANEANMRRSRPHDRKRAGAALPSVQCEVGGSRGSELPGGSERISTPEFVDIITAGFPCQDLSVAGKRAGLAGQRSALFFEVVRIVAEMREASNGRYPTVVVLENVPGLLSSHGGRDFTVVLRELALCGAVDIGWRILDAQYFGLAQRRRRVFVVADFGGRRAGEILALADSLSGHPAPRRTAGEGVAGPLSTGASSSGGHRQDLDGTTYIPLLEVGARTNEGFDTSEDGTGRGTPLVAFGISGEMNASCDVVGTLDAGSRSGGGQPAMVAVRTANTGANGHGVAADVAHTLDAGYGDSWNVQGPENHLAATYWNGADIADTLDASNASKQQAMPEKRRFQAVVSHMQVRRLTPTECERLQGFPDGYTASQSDSTRYRQLGNSVAVPVVTWLLGRVRDALEADR